MQTSFMHPPFGFALFYLRRIAAPSVKSSDIYLGALPWVGMHLLLVAILIFWPESVTYWLDKGPKVDPNCIQIKVDMPSLEGGLNGLPGLNIPPPTLPSPAK